MVYSPWYCKAFFLINESTKKYCQQIVKTMHTSILQDPGTADITTATSENKTQSNIRMVYHLTQKSSIISKTL